MIIEVSVSLVEQLDIQDFIQLMESKSMTCKRSIVYDFKLYAEIEYSTDFSNMISLIQSIVKKNGISFQDVNIDRYGVRNYISLKDGILKQSRNLSTLGTFLQDDVNIDLFHIVSNEQVYFAFSIILSLIGTGVLKFYEEYEEVKVSNCFLTNKILKSMVMDLDIGLHQIKFNSLFDAYVVDFETPYSKNEYFNCVVNLLDCMNFSYNRVLGDYGSHLRFHYFTDTKKVRVLSKNFAGIDELFSLSELLEDRSEFGPSFRGWLATLFLKNRKYIEYKGNDEFERAEAWKYFLRSE